MMQEAIHHFVTRTSPVTPQEIASDDSGTEHLPQVGHFVCFWASEVPGDGVWYARVSQVSPQGLQVKWLRAVREDIYAMGREEPELQDPANVLARVEFLPFGTSQWRLNVCSLPVEVLEHLAT
eukprot:TRINITY_DN8403_c0_g1_i2.p2 TRINITY_DN8403_c0_g1~~TRINITY_DN8403_c0_g1_i2.p2  ORF type:complete len:123 (+),score=12.49 TRINITY_DN8403_c0_g1_i2:666-1034(+)